MRLFEQPQSERLHGLTEQHYAGDWSNFEQWCHGRGFASLPATPHTIAAYGECLMSGGRMPRTVLRALSAIASAHRDGGCPLPRDDYNAVGRLRKRLRALRDGSTPTLAVLAAGLRSVVASLDNELVELASGIKAIDEVRRLTNLRDRALILVGFAGALKNGELRSMLFENVVPIDEGVLIRVCGSYDPTRGRDIAIARGFPLTDPIRALADWMELLERRGIRGGPIWRPVRRDGVILERALGDDRITAIVEARFAKVGLDARRLRTHSLRAGSIAQIAMENAPADFILKHGGYHPLSFRALVPLVERARELRPHAGKMLGI